MIYFTADHHDGHKNILANQNSWGWRKFKTSRDARKHIVEQHNKVVKATDTVYMLGDLTLRSRGDYDTTAKYIEQLNGELHLILGNHDNYTPWQYLQMGFSSVHTSLKIKLNSMSEEVILVHDPACAVYPNFAYIVGHVHILWKEYYSQLLNNILVNVGIDVWDYKPVDEKSISNILNKYLKLIHKKRVALE